MDSKQEEKIEETLKEQLHKAYLNGLSTGGKTFVGVIYDIILKDKKNRINPMKTLIKIEQSCKRMLSVSDSYNKKTFIESVAEEINKYEDKEEAEKMGE